MFIGARDQIRTGIPSEVSDLSYSRSNGRSPSRSQRVAIVEFIDVYEVHRP